jgi:hypothetical protein
MRTLLVVLVMLACSSRNDEELGRTATQAMKELNDADDAFPKQIKEASVQLGADLLISPARAADTVKTQVLPLFDRYLATLDRAVTAADAYLATLNDETSKQNVDVVRKRGAAFRRAREGFADLEHKARAGVSTEELNKLLMSIGVTMLTAGK